MAEPSAEVQGRIFISYRRDDAAYPAGWLFDRLAERFGHDQIFKDVDAIELGDDFVEEISAAVSSTDVLLAVIGEKWLTVTDEHGSRRLDDPEDFVRIEIEAALKRKVLVIPILVEGANMPHEEQLPPSLSPLARRQALELSPARFTADTSKLLAAIERALAEARAAEEAQAAEEARAAAERARRAKKTAPPTTPSWPSRLKERPELLVGIVVAVVLVALGIGGILLFSGSDESTPPEPSPSPTTVTESEPLPPPGENGRIAYLSDEELWSVRPNGRGLRELTEDWAEVRRPDWSPDGTKIVFASNHENDAADFDLWIYDTEDETVTPLTSGPEDDGAPDWSPDGTEIAFGRGDPGEDNKDIFIVEVESEVVRPVTDDPADDDAPDWSKTNRIAFESNRDGHDYEIYTLDPTGTETETDVQQVTKNDWHDQFPDWSFDGRLIAYRSNPGGENSDSDIYAIAVATKDLTRVTNNAQDDHRPSWSPDGQLIAFDSKTGGQTDVFVVTWNEGEPGEPEPLLTGSGNQEAPAWGTAP